MANNPNDTDTLSFWLRFNSLGHTNWYQISEPIGFDGAKFVIEQEPKRFARSVKYGAIDKLKFIEGYTEYTGVNQTVNPQGDQSDHLDYGLQWLLYIYKKFGFEMDVDFKIMVGNTDFQIYGLDANDKNVTDRYTYFQCKLIDNGKVMDYKRRMDDKLNMFADKGVFEQPVTPLATFNYLKRATPVNQKSSFKSTNTACQATATTSLSGGIFPVINRFRFAANNCNVQEEYGIENTLGYISSQYQTSTASGFQVPNDSNNFTYIEALNDLNNFQLDIKNISAWSNASFSSNPDVATGTGNAKLLVIVGNDLESEAFDAYTLWSRTFSKSNPSGNALLYLPTSFSLNIPFIERGKRIYIYFACESDATFSETSLDISFASIVRLVLNSMNIEMSCNSVALDNVVKAVRYVDLFKQANLMFHNLPFYAPKFDLGGRFYDQAVFNKLMVSQRTDNLYTTLKDLIQSTEEVCADVELLESEFNIGQFEDFYINEEIGVYQIIPSEEFNSGINERFAVNRINYNYSKFAQDRDLSGTDESVHTQSEWRVQNDNVENKKEIKIDLVRDPLEIQNIVDLEISKPTTSTDQDDLLCIEDMIALAPNSFGIVNARLALRIENGLFEILNKGLTSNNGVVINWTALGIVVGQNVEVLNGNNAGIYTVFAITSSVLTLSPTFAMTPIPPADYFFSMKHYYSNVQWQTRTNQGFSLIDGVGIGFGNLRYTIKRNLFNWYKYMASFTLYNGKDVINTYFKSNGALETQLTSETTPVIENGTILNADLPTPILTGEIINLTVVSDWTQEIDFLQKYELPNPNRLGNQRRKGFVRFYDLEGNVIKGYVQNGSLLASTNAKELTLEEKYELEILTVNVVGSDLFVNDVKYNLSGNTDWFMTNNDFIKFFDDQNRPICNFYEYNFVILQGVTYNSINDLVTALNLLV